MAQVPAARRRGQFIVAAFKVIATEGVAKATTRRIAEVAGAPAATVHYVFKTKDELLRGTFEAGTAEGLSVFADAVHDGIGLAAAVEALFRECFNWFIGDRDVQLAQWDLILWALRTDASDRLAGDLYRRYLDTTVEALQRAATPREQDVDLREIAHLMLALIDGFAFQWMSMPEFDLKQKVELAIGLVQTYVAAQTPAPATGLPSARRRPRQRSG